MKKFLPIIIGLIVGIAVSAGLIFHFETNTAHSEIGWWDEAVAYGDFFEWSDIFSPSSKGKNLYSLVHDKIIDVPEHDALKQIAQKFGLTQDEAKAVLDGSIIPLFNSPSNRKPNMTQDDAILLMSNLQDDFAILKEIYEIEQEIDVSITPSEIFANDDLSDSGFDLIHDLTIMEQILFVDVIPNTVGDPFGGELDSPYLPTDKDQTNTDFIGSDANIESDNFGLGEGDGVLNADNPAVVKNDIKRLEEDVCPTDNGLNSAVKDADDREQADQNDDDGGDGDDDQGDNGDDGGNGDDDQGDGPPDANDVQAAPSDEWLKSWCPALVGPGTNANAWNTFGFSSIGESGIVNALVNQSAGASAAFEGPGVNAQVSICLETELIWKTISSYQPGQSCVLCEVEKINELMAKTLSHTLIPNKATGNLLESAKCKDAYGAFLDMNFIAIAAPIPAPPNDDIIFGKNIYEEWKKYVDRYQPLLLKGTGGKTVSEFKLEYVPENTTQSDLMISITKDIENASADARIEIENMNLTQQATNTKAFSQAMMSELKQITLFFKNYIKVYEDTNTACEELRSKPYLE